jgi:hypothetical protein
MDEGVTPICNDCGVFLCWDLSESEAEEAREFWDAWICRDCNGGEPLSLREWLEQRAEM